MSRSVELYERWKVDDKIDSFVLGSELERKAFEFAREKHSKTVRKDGSEYFTHCVAVANILRKWGVGNEELVAAALCHDLVEDEEVSLETLEAMFGSNVKRYVDGVTKLRSKDGKSDLLETRRKVVDRAYLEPEVALIKLADRFHNLLTMDFMPIEKQKMKARETLDVYTPLAESLGMWRVKSQLEDLSLKFLDKERFEWVAGLVDRDLRLDEENVANIESYLAHLLEVSGIKGRVDVRLKGYYEADRKRERIAKKGRGVYDDVKSVNDLISYRVVLDESGDEGRDIVGCYGFLGMVHQAFGGKVDMDRFDDFIVSPRVNNYRALQTTIQTENGPIEIAIATSSMEDFNSWGVVSLMRKGMSEIKQYVQKIVFLPSGKIRFFPKTATGWDIAYEISPILGERAKAIIVDNERKPLSFLVPNGSVVKVEYSTSRVEKGKSVVHALPRTYKRIEEEKNRDKLTHDVEVGREKATRILSKYGFVAFEDLKLIDREMESGRDMGFESLPLATVLVETGCVTAESLYGQLGSGAQSEVELISILERLGLSKEKLGWTTIVASGVDKSGILARISAVLEEMKGNIVLAQNTSVAGRFDMKMIMTGLDKIEEEKLRQELLSWGSFGELLVI